MFMHQGKSDDDILIFPESKLWHVMRIVSNRDSLYGLSNFFFFFFFVGVGEG